MTAVSHAPARNGRLILPSDGSYPLNGPGPQDQDRLRYYVTLFGQQRRLNIPYHAHSFAAFAEVNEARGTSRSFVISWLPQSLRISLFRMPEPGRNLNLADSIAWAVERQAATTAYGPFEIRKELFEAAERRHLQLERGLTGFVCIDSWFRPFVATNCIHALSDLGLSPSLLVTGLAYGNKASLRVLRHYGHWIVNPQASHPWVGDVLGLYRHPVAFATAV